MRYGRTTMWPRRFGATVAGARCTAGRRHATRSRPACAVQLKTAALGLMLLAIIGLRSAPAAETRHVPDTFTATTANMTPAGVTLKIDVVQWSDAESRAAVVAALASDTDTKAALAELPTLGYIWPSGSAVGYAVKYAQLESDAGGAEHVTLVTDRPVGSYNFKPWTVAGRAAADELEYSVIELRLTGQGNGTGTMSLASEVIVDQDANAISLDHEATAGDVLNAVARVPKPYWARDDD